MGWTGTRPRTNIGMLERAGVDVIVNGAFTADSADWSKGVGWTINGATAGKANCDGSQVASSVLSQSVASMTPGNKFRVILTISAHALGTLYPYIGGSGATPGLNTDATHVVDGFAAGSTDLLLIGDANWTADLDDVSAQGLYLS